MIIVADPNRLGMIYTDEFKANWDKDTEKAYGALFIRLCKFQSIMITTNYLIHSMEKPSKMFMGKRYGLFVMLNNTHYKRLPSMLTVLPKEPSAIYRSTFKHIARKLIPLETELQQILYALNRQYFGTHYNPWGSQAVQDILESYAPEGFNTPQKTFIIYCLQYVNILH